MIWPGIGNAPDGQAFPKFSAAGRFSKFVHQVAHLYLQGFSDLEHRSQRNFHIAALHFAYEIMVQIRFFRQLLLSEMSLLSAVANFFAQYAAMMWFRRHSPFTRTGRGQFIHTV